MSGPSEPGGQGEWGDHPPDLGSNRRKTFSPSKGIGPPPPRFSDLPTALCVHTMDGFENASASHYYAVYKSMDYFDIWEMKYLYIFGET